MEFNENIKKTSRRYYKILKMNQKLGIMVMRGGGADDSISFADWFVANRTASGSSILITSNIFFFFYQYISQKISCFPKQVVSLFQLITLPITIKCLFSISFQRALLREAFKKKL